MVCWDYQHFWGVPILRELGLPSGLAQGLYKGVLYIFFSCVHITEAQEIKKKGNNLQNMFKQENVRAHECRDTRMSWT